jgi:hypothetical protein
MRVNPWNGAFLAALPLLCSLARAEDSKSELDSVRLGDVWYGPKVTVEDLKGRVVLIDFWGLK